MYEHISMLNCTVRKQSSQYYGNNNSLIMHLINILKQLVYARCFLWREEVCKTSKSLAHTYQSPQLSHLLCEKCELLLKKRLANKLSECSQS